MAISVADNFSYQGGKPLDARMKFDTVALMVATPAASLYDGCFAYVKATKKYYSYDSANETDPTLGKWVEYSSGDAPEYDDFTGATSEAAGVHGLVPAPAIADREKFLKGDGTWGAIVMPSFDYSNTSPEAMNFSTDEKVIGTWVDGKPLYQKVVDCGTLPNNSDKYINTGITNAERLIFAFGNTYNSNNTAKMVIPRILKDSADIMASFTADLSQIRIVTESDRSSVYAHFVLRYTKTTDTAVVSGEKIVGQWIDGKPLYQKTVNLSIPSDYTAGTTISLASGISNLAYGMVVSGRIKIGDNGNNLPLNYNANDAYAYCSITGDGTIIRYKSSFADSNISLIVIIQYTKTTD